MKFHISQLLVISLISLLSCSDPSEETIPAPPSNLSGNAISATQIDLSWTDNSTNEDGFEIERKSGSDPYSLIATLDKDISIYSDDNLALGTSYTYRVSAYNSAGKSLTYSNEFSLATKSLPELLTTPITSISSSSAISGGTVVSDGGSVVTSRGVVWSTSEDPTINLLTKTTDGTGNGIFESSLTALIANTTYYVRAYATNEVGTSYGNQVTFQTKSPLVPVADGFFITKAGTTPVISDKLIPEKVESEGFSSQVREGFYANLVYLTAGNYNVVSIINQQISQTLGGPVIQSPSTGSDCNGLSVYTLVEEFTVDGAAIPITVEGLYKTSIDLATKEILLYKIEKFNLLGGATEFGWSNDAKGDLLLNGIASATSVNYKVTDLVMKKGEYKLRYNCRWTIDRRINPANGFAASNGYVAFTSFGGTVSALEVGGANLQIAFGNDGKYTVEVKWTPTEGLKMTTTNTAPIAIKSVNDYAWGIIGSATPIVDGSADTNLVLQAGSTATAATYEVASIALSEGGEFKIRANDAWTIVLKPGIEILGTVTGDSNFESTGGGDPNWKVKVGGGGNYKITVATTNSGEKWNLTFVKL